MTTTLNEVPERLQVDFDVYDPSLTAPVDRTHEAIAELRKRGPVVYSNLYGGHWVVTGYSEIQQVFRDPETFSSWPNNLVDHGAGRFLPLEVDPPEHTAYRHALQPLFNPNRMKALAPQLRAVVGELLDGFADRGHADFVAEFAHELPTRAFLTLMGWPVEDGPKFTEWTDTTLLGKPGASQEESDAARADAARQTYEYFAKILADRRNRSDDDEDITASIIKTPIEINGEKRLLTDDELCNMFHLLLIAGLHTTQGSLAWTVIHLSDRPEQRKRLSEDSSLVPSAVEEMLRMEAAVAPGRRATRDVELGGVQVRAGDRLLLMLAGANRDGQEFDGPDALELERTPNRHLSFGSGPHRCLGSHLARIELQVALEELYRRLPDCRVDPEQAPLSHSSQVRGVARMPVIFTPETK